MVGTTVVSVEVLLVVGLLYLSVFLVGLFLVLVVVAGLYLWWWWWLKVMMVA